MRFFILAIGFATTPTLGPLHAAEFSGFPIDYAALPMEARQPIPIDITTDDFKARLKEGGTIVLKGNTTVIGDALRSKKTLAFLALDRLELRDGAKIVTNGNHLVIFANTVVSEDGEIISFRDEDIKSVNGGNGEAPSESGAPGEPGLSGGVVTVHVIDDLEGRLRVNIRGQHGGDGGDGAAGSKGARGSDGQNAQDGPLGVLGVSWCGRGGGNGGAGGKGFPGGAGGPGGPGGDGGYFELVNIGASPLPDASYSFSAEGGNPGANGSGGSGGQGGDGGGMGRGSTYCSGGNGGPDGPEGDDGTTLAESSPHGANGNLISKNLNLEVVVRSAVVPMSPVQ